jgi:hypothetical protein
MLDLPSTIPVTTPDGTVHEGQPMWTYWALQEGTLAVDPGEFTTNEGAPPPVCTSTPDAPLYDDLTGDLITDQMWGIYYKPDFYFGGVQGGTSPYVVAGPAAEVAVDPYGPESPGVHGDRGLRPDVDLGAGALPWAVRAQAPPVPARAHRGHRRVHAGQLPGLRRASARTPTWSPTPTTATR